VAGVAGGAIMGDGRVGLILDLEKLYTERGSDATR
jgi:chemotaxis protein histidine kinase CheA